MSPNNILTVQLDEKNRSETDFGKNFHRNENLLNAFIEQFS